MQKRIDTADENEEGQDRIKGMLVDNQIDIKEGEKQNGDDSGKDNGELIGCRNMDSGDATKKAETRGDIKER